MDMITITESVTLPILHWNDLTPHEKTFFDPPYDEIDEAEFVRWDDDVFQFSDWETAPAGLARHGGWEKYDQINFRGGFVLKRLADQKVEVAMFST